LIFTLRNIVQREFHPSQLLVFSFIVAILMGTFLLKLPGAVNGEPLSLLDALFTATSAICVTGLIVVDTGARFTQAGQLIILFLIQLGGLGIMTFSVVFIMMLGKKISFKEKSLIQEAFVHSSIKDVKSIVVSVLLFTLIIEAAGAVILFVYWAGEFDLSRAFHLSLFHSISAFCNAGFALFPDSLMRYNDSLVVNLTMMALIFLGGIGFYVLMDLRYYLFPGASKRRRLSLHSKVVLLTSAILTATGALAFFVMERGHTLKADSIALGILESFFQSVTARTAGFNTVDISLLNPETLFFMIILMFIGASSGSTGGGVKTGTIGVLFALVKSRYAGRMDVSIFKRTVPADVVARALSIVVISSIVIILFAMGLMMTDHVAIVDVEKRARFVEILFESVSAFGTVGLSTGVTSTLTDAGKILVSVLMFIGRLGPLTIALAAGRKVTIGRYRYAEERIMTG